MPLLLCRANQLPRHSARSYNSTYHHNHHADHTPPQPDRERLSLQRSLCHLPHRPRLAYPHGGRTSLHHTSATSWRYRAHYAVHMMPIMFAHRHFTTAIGIFLSNCLEEKFRYSHLPEKQLHHTSRQSRLCPQGAWRYCNRAGSTRGCEEMEIQLRIDYFSCRVLNFFIDSFDYYYIGMPQRECKDRMRCIWLC